MKKFLLSALALVTVAALAITGTIAYLTWEDSDVNVMTVGNVEIDQIEQQWNADNTELVDFRPGKPLMPYVGAFGWENTDEADGAYRRFTMNNVVDKYVSVKNTGKSDAYVRTVIALEMGEYSYDEFNMIGLSINSMNGTEFQFDGAWEWTNDFVTEIDGHNYNIMVAVHHDPVKPGETTIPSLLQVYLSKDANNAEVEKLDGNDNGTYDIFVCSQAVQVAGFENANEAFDSITTFAAKRTLSAAEIALNTAFYEVSITEHPWDGSEDAVNSTIPVMVDSVQELKDAMLIRGAKIFLADDIVIEKDTPLQWGAYMFVANGREVTIDLNGKNIIVEEDASLKTNGLFTTANGGTLNIVGEGTVEVKNAKSGIFHAMNKNDQINVYGGTFISNSSNGSNALAIIYTNSGNVDVYGGVFCPLDGTECANAEDIQGNRLSIVFHEGAILKHTKYYAGSDASRIQLAAGCEFKEIVIDGQTWYQVVAK